MKLKALFFILGIIWTSLGKLRGEFLWAFAGYISTPLRDAFSSHITFFGVWFDIYICLRLQSSFLNIADVQNFMSAKIEEKS